MILSIVVVLCAIFGNNINSIKGDEPMDSIDLLRDVVAFYPIPQLKLHKPDPSTIYRDNANLLKGTMDLYSDATKPNLPGGGWTYLGANNSLLYYPMDRFVKRRYNITQKTQPGPSKHATKMDEMWFKYLRDSFTDVVQNQYFFIPQRKPFNTNVPKPRRINPFMDIFNRNATKT